MLSYWEKQSFESYDYLVIGGGLVGLSTAISLKEKGRNLNIAVVERGILPTGASTKNAGFACFGSPTELAADIDQMGEEKALGLVEKRWRGLVMLRERLGDSHIGYENKGGYELVPEGSLGILDKLDFLNDWLYPLFERRVFDENKELVNSFGVNSDFFKTIIHNPFEGQVHTGQLMKSLISYAQLLGVAIYTGTEATQWEEEAKNVRVSCQSGSQKLNFQARKIALCTNAFTKQLAPDIDLKPGRGLVMVTEPIDQLPFRGTFQFNQGFYYFRDIHDRVLLGGGRQLDVKAEETVEFGVNQVIYDELITQLEKNILQKKIKIDTHWSGIMAFGESKQPIVKMATSGVAIGVRMGGMGVALGSMIGEELSGLLLSED